MVISHLENKYTSGDYNNCDPCIRNNCREGNCRLSDIDRTKHLILHGDNIESCKNNPQTPPSCDCIILKRNYDNKVLLVELRRGQCSLNVAKDKFIFSSKEILKAINEKTDKFPKLCHILLGKIDDSGLKSPDRSFWIDGKYYYIDVKPCGVSINKIKNF